MANQTRLIFDRTEIDIYHNTFKRAATASWVNCKKNPYFSLKKIHTKPILFAGNWF